jgi:hypothetical protein
VRAHVAAQLSGLSSRTITQLASKGDIPGAAKHGGVWTFDADLLATWITYGNARQKTSINKKTVKTITSASRSTEKNTESRLKRLLNEWRNRGQRRTKGVFVDWRARLAI